MAEWAKYSYPKNEEWFEVFKKSGLDKQLDGADVKSRRAAAERYSLARLKALGARKSLFSLEWDNFISHNL